MNTPKTVLIILPKLTGYGGMQLENIGFMNSLCEKTNLVIKLFSIEVDYESKSLINNNVEFYRLKKSLIIRCFSIWFLKLLLRTKFNLRKSVRIYLESHSEIIKTYLINETKKNDIIFCSLHPQNLVQYVHLFCNLNQRKFFFHPIENLNIKYSKFYYNLTLEDTVLISSQHKKEQFKKYTDKPKFKNIRQWIYTKEDEFFQNKNIFEGETIFGVISRLSKRKNIILLLKAISEIKIYNFKVLIFGEGSELESLKLFSKENSLVDKVFFMGDINYEKRHNAYSKINVFMCTSWSEGGPITVLEAMAAGLPVISTNVGDVTNRIINDKNGYVLNDNDDATELSKLMLNYIKNTKLIKSHGNYGRRRYLKEYHSKIGKEIFVEKILNSND